MGKAIIRKVGEINGHQSTAPETTRQSLKTVEMVTAQHDPHEDWSKTGWILRFLFKTSFESSRVGIAQLNVLGSCRKADKIAVPNPGEYGGITFTMSEISVLKGAMILFSPLLISELAKSPSIVNIVGFRVIKKSESSDDILLYITFLITNISTCRKPFSLKNVVNTFCQEISSMLMSVERKNRKLKIIKDQLNCKFFRYNPDCKKFNIYKTIQKLMVVLYDKN
jgi:hypothetical protein